MTVSECGCSCSVVFYFVRDDRAGSVAERGVGGGDKGQGAKARGGGGGG